MHIVPAMSGFCAHLMSLIFQHFDETTYYYYILTTMASGVLLVFFGFKDYYSTFQHQYIEYLHVGCKVGFLPEKLGANKVVIYYPAQRTLETNDDDIAWAMEGASILKGITKFSFGWLP